MPRFALSALMPNYNHSQFLPTAIEAVVGQSRLPEEYLIVDDASTDNSVAVIEDYARRYPVIRLARNETNQGVCRSTERLLELAAGAYVYFGAADDWILPGFFEQAMAMAEQYPAAGVICGKVAVVDADNREAGEAGASAWPAPLYASPEVFLREYMEVEYPGHSLSCATLWRREALQEVGGFRPELGHWADSFALRAIALKHGACYVPERWAVYRAMPDSFGHRQLRNHLLALELLDRAVALMRSEAFRDRFPETHVVHWQHQFQRMIFEDWVWARRARFGRGRKGLWVGRLYKRYLLLKAARKYHGDLAALMRAEPGKAAPS